MQGHSHHQQPVSPTVIHVHFDSTEYSAELFLMSAKPGTALASVFRESERMMGGAG
jgi:hypothetical protein